MQRVAVGLLLLSVGALSLGVGCATGATIDGVGGAGSGGANASNGTKSTASKGSMSSSMSTSTDSSMSTAAEMSSTAADPNCPEQPCKLIAPQCGCTAGRMCSVGAMGERECIAEGTAPIGAGCGSEECVAGSMCLGPAANALSCLEFCDDDSDCTGPGGICYFTIDDGNMGSVPGVKLCTPNCDPATNSGCPTGLGCQAVRDMTIPDPFTFCAQAGAGGDLAPCAGGFKDCAPTFGCFTQNGNDVCLKWCKVGGGSACPSGTTCQQLVDPLIVGATEYGVCD